MPGYSAKPLVAKLGFEAGTRVLGLDGAPDDVARVHPLPEACKLLTRARSPIDAAHAFATRRRRRETLVDRALALLRCSWPKRSF